MGMDHPFEHRAHYNPQGKPCHCPWGTQDPEHLGSVKEASKLDWLKGRPDLQTNEGQDWLHFLGEGPGSYAEADKLLPWLTREWQKGRLVPDHTNGLLQRTDPTTGPPFISPEDATLIQNSLQEMKERRQGVDVMQHKVHELVPKVNDFIDWKQSQKRKDLGEVLHRFDDGWTVRRLQNHAEHKDEGDLMGHCIGKEGTSYADDTEDGRKIYASLRDEKNLPHATMELSPDYWMHDSGTEEPRTEWPGTPAEGWRPQVGPESALDNFYGKGNAPPIQPYYNRVNQWLGSNFYPTQAEAPPQPVLAAAVDPLYYRWVFSPTKGVTLGANEDDHPALVPYHQGLGGSVDGQDLQHGYAYRIGNGWRLTDWEHRAVEDPYIVSQVVRALNAKETPQIVAEGSWRDADIERDWDRLHFSLPC